MSDNPDYGLPPLVSAPPVAEYLGVTKPQLYALCRSGIVPHTRVGRSIRFSPSAIVMWAESGGSSYPCVSRKDGVR